MKPRFTVCWHPAVTDDLARMWISSLRREAITSAWNQAEQALASNPAAAGLELAADQIDADAFRILMQRVVPTQGSGPLRVLAVEPLEVCFSVREEDLVVTVWMIRQESR